MSSFDYELEGESPDSDLETPLEYDYVGTVPVFASHMSPDTRSPRDLLGDFMSFNLVSISTKDLRRVLEAIQGSDIATEFEPKDWFTTFHTLIARADNDFHVLFDAFSDPALEMNLVPIMLWTYQSAKPNKFIEPLLAKVYRRNLPIFNRSLRKLPFGKNFSEITNETLTFDERSELLHFLILAFGFSCTERSRDAIVTYLDLIENMCKGIRAPPLRPNDSPGSERTVVASITKDIAKSIMYTLHLIQETELADVDSAIDAVRTYATAHSLVEVLFL